MTSRRREPRSLDTEENPLSRPTLRRRVGVAAAAAVLGLASASFGAPAAQAVAPAGFDVDVTPTTGLSDGDVVTVTLTDVAPGDGVYVMYCVQPAPGERATGPECDATAQAWVTDAMPPGGGVVAPGQPVEVPVATTIGDADCTEVVCGIQVRRDHVGAEDTSYDTFVPLAFAAGGAGDGGDGGRNGNDDEPAGFSVDVSPTTDLQDGDVVDVTLTGVPSDVGLYVQFCVQQPGGQRAAGDQCDGSGTWAVGENPYGAGTDSPVDGPILDPADGPIPTTVRAAIGSVDCTEVVCGIQTRRDHRGGGDTTYDSFTPVTFAADVQAPVDDAAGTDDEGATGSDTGAGGEELAATGTSLAGPAAVSAVALLVAGAALVGATRRGALARD